MFSRGIRGAITVDKDLPEEIKNATIELVSEILEKNQIEKKDISHVIFTLTKDLKSAFPAKFARESLHFENVPMMCFNELSVDGSLEKCLRALVVVNTEKSQEDIKHIYLKGAKILRTDLTGN